MVLDYNACNHCHRPFLTDVDEGEDVCAVCIAYTGRRELERDEKRLRLEEAKLQHQADIVAALRALVDVIDKARP